MNDIKELMTKVEEVSKALDKAERMLSRYMITLGTLRQISEIKSGDGAYERGACMAQDALKRLDDLIQQDALKNE